MLEARSTAHRRATHPGHAAITSAPDAGGPLRDTQILARHADPRTTEHCDSARTTSPVTRFSSMKKSLQPPSGPPASTRQ
jgi:hypothetical protein